MFIVGIDTPEGQATYHYDIDPYWDMFDCKELERAPEWDGHTPAEAIERISKLDPSAPRNITLPFVFHAHPNAEVSHKPEAFHKAGFLWYLSLRQKILLLRRSSMKLAPSFLDQINNFLRS